MPLQRNLRRHVLLARYALIAGLGILPSAAAAQSAERPIVKPGDQWQFVVAPDIQPNRHWVIELVNPENIVARENGEPLTLTPELNVLASPRSTESNPRALGFPLEVGKRWSYQTDWTFHAKGSRGNLMVDVEVVGYETVSVPAGAFKAFKLVSTGRVGGVSPIGSQYDANIVTTYWYAPSARAIVRSIRRNPYLGTSTVELVSFQLRQ